MKLVFYKTKDGGSGGSHPIEIGSGGAGVIKNSVGGGGGLQHIDAPERSFVSEEVALQKENERLRKVLRTISLSHPTADSENFRINVHEHLMKIKQMAHDALRESK